MRPVDLRFGGSWVRQLDRSMGPGQIGYHRIHRIMDILQVEVGRYLTFLQPHSGQVSETDSGLGCTFGATGEVHLLRQEVRKVRQVGIEVQRQIEQHIAHEVFYSAVSSKFGVFGFCRQPVNLHVGYLSFGKPYVCVGIQLHIAQGIRQRFVRSFSVFQRQMRLHARHLGFGYESLYDRLQFGFSVHIEVAERLGEFLRHKRHERLDLPFAFGSETQVQSY